MKKFLMSLCVFVLICTVCIVPAFADGGADGAAPGAVTGVTYMVVIAFLTFVLAQALKFCKVPTRAIPIINIVVGVAAALLCFFTGILPGGSAQNFVNALITCVTAALGAGGAYDVGKNMPKNSDDYLIDGGADVTETPIDFPL
ncbi:MAG: hypothetical protein RSD27_11050 [Ruthenibacterium sp.]